jgi:uncharacterized protein (TIGR02679 family)
MTSERERLERLLGGELLSPLRARLRRRFARVPMPPLLTLARLAAHERRALEGLLGRRTREADSLRVSIAELDDAVSRAGLATSFRHALELLDGPIPDLLALRAAQERAWLAAYAHAQDPRLCEFLESSAARGLVRRLALGKPELAARWLESATRVLARLPAPGSPRSRLAADTLGDAHALDRRRPIATLTLAALRRDEDERDREIWARNGVLVNELAAPALVLNLPAEPDTATGQLANAAREFGAPLHFTLRALLREAPRWRARGRDVFVCENANVVSIAADRLGSGCAPLICTDGMPSASQRSLLQQLQAQGARLRYHGDFDWPGLRIANFVMRSFGATAWRFGSSDYAAVAGKTLSGELVVASWDAELAPRMAAAGFALEEEAVVDVLLQDLAGGAK